MPTTTWSSLHASSHGKYFKRINWIICLFFFAISSFCIKKEKFYGKSYNRSAFNAHVVLQQNPSYLSIRKTYKTHKNDVTFLTSQMILLVWLSYVKISLNDSIEFYFNKFVQNVAILIGFMQSHTTTNISVLFCFELKREKKNISTKLQCVCVCEINFIRFSS